MEDVVRYRPFPNIPILRRIIRTKRIAYTYKRENDAVIEYSVNGGQFAAVIGSPDYAFEKDAVVSVANPRFEDPTSE